jgi:cell division protein FtsX
MDDIHQVEIVIHVDETLSEEKRANLVNHILGRDGVEKARFTTGREHLMVVDYDSNKLHSTDVLDYVKQEHVHAELIGI